VCWQLYELDTGELHRCPPKDDSHRTIDTPDWLGRLVSEHIARTEPKPCQCHALTYVFTGHRPPNGAVRRPGATLVDVARLAGVSPATASAGLNHPEVVHEATRARIDKAIADLGYVRGGAGGELAAHWRRNNFATWLFHPAANGWYPSKGGRLAVRPVPVLGEPWPGIPVRGRNAAGRADACWLPIAPGLTPHGLRHTHRTLIEELGTPAKLADDRMGHEDGSVQARYTHVTSVMRRRLLVGLTDLWVAALDARMQLAERSPVAVLDRVLVERRTEVGK
jgi:Bacterial regulatory proteins, lacI family